MRSNAIFTIFKKELARFFKDRRTLIALLMPGLLIYIIYSLMGGAMGDAFMPDEDYGKSFNHIIYNYGYLGVKRYLNGDEESAIRCFEEEVRLAKAFDSLPDISVGTSPVVNGAIFEL